MDEQEKPYTGFTRLIDWTKDVLQVDLVIALFVNYMTGVNIKIPQEGVLLKENDMNKDIMYAYCDTCKCITPKELRVTETVCIKCKTKVIDDAEELFGQLEDSYDKR